MPDILLLPQPDLAFAGTVLYLSAGLLFCALVGAPIPQRCAQPGREGFGAGPGFVLLVTVTLLAGIVLWPVPLAWMSVRRWTGYRTRLRAPRHPAQFPLRTVLDGEDEVMDPPVYLTQAQGTAVGGQEDPVPGGADWTGAAAARVVAALGDRRLLDAAWAARTLWWDAERAFGPNSSQLWHATELLAHVCHEIGDDVRAVQLYARAAHGWARNFGTGHPEARAAYDRACALWGRACATGTTDSVTTLLMACVARLFAQAGLTGDV